MRSFEGGTRVHANCGQVCVYFFKLFQKIGSKVHQIKQNQEMKKFKKSKINCYNVINQILLIFP